MTRNRTSLFAVLAVVVVAALAFGSRLVVWSNGEHAPQASLGGPFTLVDGNGRTVTDQDFRGRWMLIYFGYTFCPDVCPTSLSVAAAAMDRLDPSDAAKIVPILITVDPQRDTPAVLKEYVAAFHPAMVGLGGSVEQVAAAAKAFKVFAARAKGGDDTSYTVDHSSILYLMGPDGRFVAGFSHGTSADDLAAALKKHLK
ncbi:MAG TPA: SCO family protein [Magnetospirillum sp.]|nr:SCO family protein [Magnetospirillum sp.]